MGDHTHSGPHRHPVGTVHALLLFARSKMACYFGCGTGANKCAYLWYFVLLLGGVGCIESTETCLEQAGVGTDGIFAGFNPKEVFEGFKGGVTAESVCTALFPDAAPDSAQLQGCVSCYTQEAPCFEATLGIFIAGVVMVAASFFMPLFCCFCAAAPQNKYYA